AANRRDHGSRRATSCRVSWVWTDPDERNRRHGPISELKKSSGDVPAGFVRTNMEVVAQELQAIPQAAMIFPLDCPFMTSHTRNIASFILAMLPTPRFPQYLHVHAMADNSKGGRRPASNPFRAPYSTFLPSQ